MLEMITDSGGTDEPPPDSNPVCRWFFDLVAGVGPHFRFAQTAEAIGLFTYFHRRDNNASNRCLVIGEISS